MPQTYNRGRSKGRAKGLPVPAMRKKEAKPLPIAAGKKQARQITTSTAKRAIPTLKMAQKGKAPGMRKENKSKAAVRRRKSR